MKQLKIIFTCLVIISSTYLSLSQDYVEYINQAKDLYQKAQYEEAILIVEEWMPEIKNRYGVYDTIYLNICSLGGLCYYEAGQYEKSLNLLDEATYINKVLYGLKHPNYAISLNNLAGLKTDIGNYEEALQLYNNARKLILQNYGTVHSENANNLNDLAQLYEILGNYDSAIILHNQALDIRKEIFGIRSTEYSESLGNVAALYYATGDYNSAISLFEEAAEIDRNIFGPDHPSYATTINNLALCYDIVGNYIAALPLMEEALKIRREALGCKHRLYTTSLSSLGALYGELGNFELALNMLEETLGIRKEIFGINHPYYAISLNNLASVYTDLGNYEKAISSYVEAIEIYKDVVGDNHPNYAIFLTNLAGLYTTVGDYEKAMPMHEEAIGILKEVLGDKHPYYASSLNNLAGLYTEMGNYDKALPLFEDAAEIFKDIFGPTHNEYANSLNNLGMIYSLLDSDDIAMSRYNEALLIRKELFGSNNSEYARTLNSIANLHTYNESYDTALTYFSEANSIINRNLIDNFSYLSTIEKARYLNVVRDDYNIYGSFQLNYSSSNSGFSVNLYNNELMLKGLILNTSAAIQEDIYRSDDSTLILQYDSLRLYKIQITSQYQKPISKRLENLNQIEQKAIDLERKLTRQSQILKDFKTFFKVDWEEIRDNLNMNEAAIEFITFDYYNGKRFIDSTFYCALVLRNKDTLPQMIYLCDESELKEGIPKPGASNRNINYLYQESKLYELIWQPIDSLLDGVNTIYLAPSGLLNSVSLDALTTPNNKLLMEEYDLVQLSSTRTLALEHEPISITDAAIYGGIIYDTDTTTLINKTEAYKEIYSDVLAYSRSYTGDYRSGFQYLPGSKEEAESISSMAEKNDITVCKYSGIDAVEESFLALSGNDSPSIIHLSTHGFYFPDTVSDENRKNVIYSSTGEVRFRYNDDPLLRSGLLMAGANLAWKGNPIPDNIEDGILTAKEVSNMNLMNTELVVLSACQSGLGDVKGSEGVEGLQRGFKMAGVRYIIMSLWQVPDKETTEFMVKFYDHWLGGKDIHKAFHQTQKHMHHKYKDDPFKWAGFVLME